jgi:uncharacterized membrane protein YciS (DUF1049 family)
MVVFLLWCDVCNSLALICRDATVYLWCLQIVCVYLIRFSWSTINDGEVSVIIFTYLLCEKEAHLQVISGLFLCALSCYFLLLGVCLWERVGVYFSKALLKFCKSAPDRFWLRSALFIGTATVRRCNSRISIECGGDFVKLKALLKCSCFPRSNFHVSAFHVSCVFLPFFFYASDCLTRLVHERVSLSCRIL